jgi:hypothetical protein
MSFPLEVIYRGDLTALMALLDRISGSSVVAAAAASLNAESDALESALSSHPQIGVRIMAAPATETLAQLTASVTRIVGVAESAIAVINGITARITAAVQAALDGGATAEELAAAVGAEVARIDAEAEALAAAVASQPGTERKSR